MSDPPDGRLKITPTTLPDNAGLVEIVAKALYLHDGGTEEEWEMLNPVRWHGRAEAAIAALRPSVWMDISTAPKDGTRILAYWRGNGDQEVVYWSIGQSCWFDTVAGIETVAPTHWTHLPTPPKAHTP